jgi:hypothetical protein
MGPTSSNGSGRTICCFTNSTPASFFSPSSDADTVPAIAVVGFGGIHEKEEDAIIHLAFTYSEDHALQL